MDQSPPPLSGDRGRGGRVGREGFLSSGGFRSTLHDPLGGRAAVENAACRLYPPVSPSMSRISPTKKRRETSLDSIVFGLISASDTPPRITIASGFWCESWPAAMNFLEGGGRARGLKEKDGREGFRGAEGGLAEERAGSSEKTRITG